MAYAKSARLAGGKDSKSALCSSRDGTYRNFDRCLLQEHPDFDKSGTWKSLQSSNDDE